MGPDPATQVAHRCAEAMWVADNASRRLGMTLDDVGPGRAVLAMPVTDDLVNGHGICHGGFIATLADSAFAVACNTYGEVTVASGFDIAFVAPAHVDDVLVAVAQERARFGRSGLYDVTIRSRRPGRPDLVVAEFRGRSRALGRPLLPAAGDLPEI